MAVLAIEMPKPDSRSHTRSEETPASGAGSSAVDSLRAIRSAFLAGGADDNAAADRSDPRRHGHRHDQRRGQAAEGFRAGRQPPDQTRRAFAGRALLSAQKRSLFPDRRGGANFEQINGVYKKVDELNFILSRVGRGDLSELRIGSVPSLSQSMAPGRSRACAVAIPTCASTSTS